MDYENLIKHLKNIKSMIRKAKNVRSHIRKVTIVRDVHSAMHLAAFQTAVQECTVLNIIREDKEAGQAVYAVTAAGIRDRNSAVLNTVQQEADTPAGQTLVAFGTVIDNRSCVTNETAGDAAAHSTTTVAQKGDAYNITSFIKEEKHYQHYYCNDRSAYADKVYTGSYFKVGYVAGTAEGYVKTFGYDPEWPEIEICTENGASSNTYFCDYYYAAEGGEVVLSGGNVSGGTISGPFRRNCSNSAGYSSWAFGGRPQARK